MSSGALIAITAGLAIAWLVLYLVLRLRSRSQPVPPGPARADFGPEPPAIVNLLVNRWQLTADAAEATLLDLAARGFLQLQQPGPDVASTVACPQPADPAHLLPYERRVLARAHQNAVDGQVPVLALSFRDEAQARAWQRSFHAEVIADARARGLSRNRAGAETQTLLTTAGGMVALVAGLLSYSLRPAWELAMVVGALVFTATGALARSIQGERDTVTGRQAAARWLGVRQWLAGQPGIAEAPPAAVHRWQRQLAYGAALGLTRVTSDLLELGLGDHRLIWSAFTGTWRRVRVRYPRGRLHYGKSIPGLLGQVLVLGFIAVHPGLFALLVQMQPPSTRVPIGIEIASWVAGAIAVLLLSYSGYCLIRGLIDLGRERELVGEVLWLRVWRKRKEGGKNSSRYVPHLHYLVLDDGTADQTTAWGLASEQAAAVVPRDVLRIRVRPWTRRVVALELLRPSPDRGTPAQPPTTPAAPAVPPPPTTAPATAAPPPPVVPPPGSVR